MAAVARTPSGKRTSPKKKSNQTESSTARLFLAAACLWPLALLALLASSATPVRPDVRLDTTNDNNSSNEGALRGNSNSGFGQVNLRNMMDRVDILGYGPTHPRVAVVVTGSDKDNLVATVESVFRTTDLNRVFVVTVVVDGHAEDKDLVDQLRKIDQGQIVHWHGNRADFHTDANKEKQKKHEAHAHGSKVHVIFNEEILGVAASRADAVDFIVSLESYHEESGLKSPEEDLILLLMRAGAEISKHSWLPAVTNALIVPPPLLSDGGGDKSVVTKLANAVSFRLEAPSHRTSFDGTLTPVVDEASAEDINSSSGSSYATPAFNGAAMALRLTTYTNLPAQDVTLTDPWPANLELSLNLWLCGDGIDILDDVEVAFVDKTKPAPMRPSLAARFAAVWMDEVMQEIFFRVYTKTMDKTTMLEWKTLMEQSRQYATADLTTKCRSFEWFVEHVNTILSEEVSLQRQQVVKDRKLQAKMEKKRHQGSVDSVREAPKLPAPLHIDGAGEEEQPAAKEKQDKQTDDSVAIPQRREEDTQRKPSKPLCQECLEIVKKAQPIDISFVDVSGGHKEHPHLGALDESGNPGYIHDETALFKNPPAFEWDDESLKKACSSRDNNYRMLTQRVSVDFEADEKAEALAKEGKMKRDKIFCLVYTIFDKHKHARIPKIRQTWGQKCDGFMVVSNITDTKLGITNVVHRGVEEYGNIWQKVRSMWSYIYDNYYEKYDWFHIGGDDYFLLVENLRLYLESEEIRTAANGGIYLPEGDERMQTPLFLGRRFAYQGEMNRIFNSGGSGYTLNKAALKTLVVEGMPKWFPNRVTFSEDTMVAEVMRKFGVYPYDTKDEAGGERYMPFMPGHHWGYHMPVDKTKDWYATYSINIKEGPEHCSPHSVAFHYVKDDAMKRLYALLYNKCPAGSLGLSS